MKNISVLFLFLLPFTGNAQKVKWAESSKTAKIYGSFNIAADNDDNTYTTGVYIDSLNMGNTALARPGKHIYLAKRNSKGYLLWCKQLDKQINQQGIWLAGISTSNDGHIYLAGEFTGTLQLGETILTSSGGKDIFIAKLDHLGNISWVKSGGGAGNEGFYFNSVVACPDGGVYLGGTLESRTATFGAKVIPSNNGLRGMFILRYDANGNVLWGRSDGEGAKTTDCFGLTIDKQGRLYVGGYFTSTATFGNQQLKGMPEEKATAYLTRYSSSGTIDWTRKVWADSAYNVHHIAVDPENNILVSGDGYNGSFLMKLDENATQLWRYTITSSSSLTSINNIQTDPLGNVFISGNFVNKLLINGGEEAVAAGQNSYVSKWDKAGVLQWVYNSEHSMPFNVSETYMTLSPSSVFVTGTFYGPSLKFGKSDIQGKGNAATLYTISLSNTTGLPEVAATSPKPAFAVHPNPARDHFFVQLSRPVTQDLQVKVSDVNGRLLQQLRLPTGRQQLDVNMSTLAAGVYYVDIPGYQTQKVLIR